MSNKIDPTQTDIRNLLHLMSDTFSYFASFNMKDAKTPQVQALLEKIKEFKEGKIPIRLGTRMYSKDDLKYLFYAKEEE